jgi:uncharacterized protein (DUF934 family)
MPRLLRDGAITEDNWLAPNPEGLQSNHLPTLSQWEALADKADSAVQLEPGDSVESLLVHLEDLTLVAVNFPVFTDGRGFSYARELRERGYRGEIRAVGHFIRDQLHYLARCGFNAFQFENESLLESARESLDDFSEHYQAAIDQPLPLFRRRG